MTPGSLDDLLVRRHLAAIDAAVQQLRLHAGGSVDALRNRDEIWAVERGLQVCIQNCLDVAAHLAAAAGRDVPDYASAIQRLGELGVLPRPLATSFRAMAGFRSVTLIHPVLNERLPDFETFARCVEVHLTKA